jgi:hypothetical protein
MATELQDQRLTLIGSEPCVSAHYLNNASISLWPFYVLFATFNFGSFHCPLKVSGFGM